MTPEQIQQATAKGSIVFIEFFGGPRDGDLLPSARSLLLYGRELWLPHRTRYASHVYISRRPWRGEKTITVYHRKSCRVVG